MESELGINLQKNIEFSNDIKDHPECFLFQLHEERKFNLEEFQKFVDDIVELPPWRRSPVRCLLLIDSSYYKFTIFS